MILKKDIYFKDYQGEFYNWIAQPHWQTTDDFLRL